MLYLLFRTCVHIWNITWSRYFSLLHLAVLTINILFFHCLIVVVIVQWNVNCKVIYYTFWNTVVSNNQHCVGYLFLLTNSKIDNSIILLTEELFLFLKYYIKKYIFTNPNGQRISNFWFSKFKILNYFNSYYLIGKIRVSYRTNNLKKIYTISLTTSPSLVTLN